MRASQHQRISDSRVRPGEHKDNRPENRAHFDRRRIARAEVSIEMMMEAVSLLAGLAIAIVIIAGPAKPFYKRARPER